MKESTGSVASIYIIIFFVVIIFGFITSIISYYKGYKINNSLTAAIEDYGGFNGESQEEIEKRLGGIVCGFRGTSCANELVNAIKEVYKK